MALSIYTNIASLNAQRSLSVNSSSLNKTLRRLSSGLRINSASDDAAGLSISTGLQSQIRGLNQAVRNASDGLSLLGTAEAAISEQTNILQRIRELAVQAASDTNSSSNRASLNNEVTELKDEFERIAQTVQFNGLNLLDGSFSTKEIQVGAFSGANQRISVDIEASTAAETGISYTLTGSSAVGSTAASAGEIVIRVDGTDYDVGASEDDNTSTAEADSSAIAFANAINEISGETGVTAEALTVSVTAGSAQDSTGGTPDGVITAGEVTINGVDIAASADVTITANSGTEIIDAINAVSGTTGVTAALNGANKIVLTAEDGRNIDVALAGEGAAVSGLTDATTHAKIQLTSLTGTFSVTDASTRINASGAATEGTDNVGTISLTTKDNANSAIDTVDAALEQLNNRRAGLGAQVNRLTAVVSNLSTISENLAASNSRILDADFASETAELTRTQILQQAATAVLAAANQNPQLALSLLR